VIKQTTLPAKEITKSLQQMGYDVMLSDDAGRFVCNYVYYHSLRFAAKHSIKSLFVHFPLFAAIDEEVQMHFVASLLEVIASLNL
jgi:pyroglutamyl-peptidase